MRLLSDTCVWSLALRRRKTVSLSAEDKRLLDTLLEAIGDGRVVLIGPIRQELLSGIREPAQFEKLRTALSPFPDEPVETTDYEQAARFYNVCRAKGIECGPVDMLICSLALRHRWSVLTNDALLTRCLHLLKTSST